MSWLAKESFMANTEIKPSFALRASAGKQNCQNCQKDFTIEPDDFDFYAKISKK